MRNLLVCLTVLLVSGVVFADDSLPKGAKARLGKAQKLADYAATSADFSLDGKLVAWTTKGTGFRSTVAVHVWDVAGRKEQARGTFTAEKARAATQVVFADRGKAVCVGTYHEQGGPAKSARFAVTRVRVWDAKSAKEINRFPDVRTADSGEFINLAVSGDNKSVVTQRDFSVQVWDAATGKLKREFEITGDGEGGFYTQALATGGQLLARQLHDGPVRLWDVATGKKKRELKGAGQVLTLSAGGKSLATVSAGKILIWDAEKGKETAQLKGAPIAADFSADGKRLAWIEKGGELRVYEVAGQKELATFKDAGRVVAFAPDGKTLASVAADGTLLLWELPAAK